MRRGVALSAVMLSLALPHAWAQAPQDAGKPKIVDRRTAPNHVTEAWLLQYPWPDQDDKDQAWRTVTPVLVISRHGRIVRRITATDIWSWNFWEGGRQVIYQAGGILHGSSTYFRTDVRTGKELERWDGQEDDPGAPAWVRAADPE